MDDVGGESEIGGFLCGDDTANISDRLNCLFLQSVLIKNLEGDRVDDGDLQRHPITNGMKYHVLLRTRNAT